MYDVLNRKSMIKHMLELYVRDIYIYVRNIEQYRGLHACMHACMHVCMYACSYVYCHICNGVRNDAGRFLHVMCSCVNAYMALLRMLGYDWNRDVYSRCLYNTTSWMHAQKKTIHTPRLHSCMGCMYTCDLGYRKCKCIVFCGLLHRCTVCTRQRLDANACLDRLDDALQHVHILLVLFFWKIKIGSAELGNIDMEWPPCLKSGSGQHDMHTHVS